MLDGDKPADGASSEGSAPADPPPTPDVDGPLPVPPKQGGCGCRAAGAPGGEGALPLAGLAFARAAPT